MGSTIFKVKINRKTHELDATGQALGRLATQAANLLHGKNKPNFAPQIDNGDFVIINNIDKLKFTGKKIEQKKYYNYSGYPGGLKSKKLFDFYTEDPKKLVKRTVYGMLPTNKLRESMIKRLTIK